MKSFATIDFETANHNRSSICSVGVVIVENEIIVDKFYRLVRPRPNFYSFWATRIHGLTYHDTLDEAEFPEVWQEISPKLKDLPLIAHNSPFDSGCLKAVHDLYGIEYPDYTFHCTCRAAKKHFPGLQNYQLKTVAKHIGYNLDNHHHALADAEVCARIALSAPLFHRSNESV